MIDEDQAAFPNDVHVSKMSDSIQKNFRPGFFLFFYNLINSIEFEFYNFIYLHHSKSVSNFCF